MVLNSQLRRAGSGRSYMSSRRRRRARWPWVVVLAALAVGGWYVWPGGETEPTGDRFDNVGRTNLTTSGQGAQAPDTSESASASAVGTGASESSGSEHGGDDPGGQAWTSGGSQNDDSTGTGLAQRDEADADEDDGVPSMTLGSDREPMIEPAEPRGSTSDAGGQQGDENRSTSGSSVNRSTSQASTTSANATGDPAAQARSAARTGSGDFQRGMDLIAEGEFVEGRRLLSRLLYSGQLTASEARTVRDTLTSVNRELIFADSVNPADPITESYQVQSGDLLVRIARQYKVPHELLMEINGIADARHLQAGQSIKLIEGPLNARIYKRAYRMDITVDGPDGEPLYVCSFPVGLGENNSTPPGEWIVAPGRKVVNPSWRNPRTGEFFSSDDPENPIGDYWIALEGADEDTAGLRGYGIHGTIDPDSIGAQASMGCIRLRDRDIEQVFYMLQGGESRVTVIP